ncbi:helix-turn-helix transcriptional regulator [Undibacterium luofuense]|uniref:AlpA family phage regulatory protein n=1 Tax=Undibacterium luofuense TaxID=2828733 RepID=A0A941I6E7_9BURK|nr:AlpA family phage regulatory protein [Undibacterium luofuense]MBR7782606.1 AlpA family phage regulatory protein [Undibacterium luofuense]
MSSSSQIRLLRRVQVEALTGLKRSSIYGRLNPNCKQFDKTFPRPISLSPTNRGSVAWLEVEVMAWIQGRIIASRGDVFN